MRIFKININSIDMNDNMFIITSTDNTKFISNINKGSVSFLVYNEDDDEINLNNLVVGINVRILGIKNKENIIIKKIYIKNNYILQSDESESDNINGIDLN
jgi:hypothetical protein